MSKYQELQRQKEKLKTEHSNKLLYWGIFSVISLIAAGSVFFLSEDPDKKWLFSMVLLLLPIVPLPVLAEMSSENSKKINKLKREMLSSEEEFNQFHSFNDMFSKTVENKKYLIIENSSNKKKILFRMEDFVIIFQRTGENYSFRKVLADGSEDKNFKFSYPICEKIKEVSSSLMRVGEEITDHEELVEEVQEVLKEKVKAFVSKKDNKSLSGSNKE